ncbi:hypothetical protein PF008_g4364 [Phytophthora fragariae]|uniref:Uncharacterized protein n=1 Tax=Phytophthora fragariae TaxID=53985 RepID=A0A6G0SBI7_9STRA|nr:hypothetical protein PF008_g4364 [Phytophthora fragariae]
MSLSVYQSVTRTEIHSAQARPAPNLTDGARAGRMLNSGTGVFERQSRTCRLLVTKHRECCQVKVARPHLRMLFEQGQPSCSDSDVHDTVPKPSKY